MVRLIPNIKDLGRGDGGKGGDTHAVGELTHAHTILKDGAFQGHHGVCTSAGQRVAFSQWGCRTLEGVKTHLLPRFIISAEGLLNEAASLQYEHSVHRPFDLLTIDERTLCATPWYGISSRLKELARGKNPRGTIGTGAGETYRYSQRLPELAIFACDLSRPGLRDKMVAVRKQIVQDLASIIHGEFLPEDREEAEREIGLLDNDAFLDYVMRRYQEAAQMARIVDPEFLGREILSKDGVAIVETSHGILTDHYQGFDPHTSAIRTLPHFTHQVLREAGYSGRIVNLGIHRAYQIQHGLGGRMPTIDPTMAQRLLPGSHVDGDRYRGKTLIGPIDLVLLNYAIACCGGPEAFGGLLINCFDQVQADGKWEVCHRYKSGADDPEFFTPEGRIKVRFGEDEAQLAHQRALGQKLQNCVPKITTYEISPKATQDQLYDLCAGVLEESLKVPVKMVSFGSTEKEKIFR